MTRKKAIEIVVANVKMRWPFKGWHNVLVCNERVNFTRAGDPHFIYKPEKTWHRGGGWWFHRTWLEENGHL